MTGAVRFMDALRDLVNNSVKEPNFVPLKPARIEVTLQGSLAFTGRGHAADRAVILGLTGLLPDTLDPDEAERLENEVRQNRRISSDGMGDLEFDPATDLVFDCGPVLPGHANEIAHSGSEKLSERLDTLCQAMMVVLIVACKWKAFYLVGWVSSAELVPFTSSYWRNAVET